MQHWITTTERGRAEWMVRKPIPLDLINVNDPADRDFETLHCLRMLSSDSSFM